MARTSPTAAARTASCSSSEAPAGEPWGGSAHIALGRVSVLAPAASGQSGSIQCRPGVAHRSASGRRRRRRWQRPRGPPGKPRFPDRPLPVRGQPSEPAGDRARALALTSRIPADAAATTPGALRAGDSTSVSQGWVPAVAGNSARAAASAPTEFRAWPWRRVRDGGERFRPGNGVTAPRVLTEVKPAYMAAAMRAKVQGLVRLDASCCPTGPSAASSW